MKSAENTININETDDNLFHLLEELSFSYSLVYSAQQSLNDLNKSINELEDLTENLKIQMDKAV
jgi:hypothetical protein